MHSRGPYREFSLSTFLTLNFIFPATVNLLFSPFVLSTVVKNPTFFDFVIFNSYMILLIGSMQLFCLGLGRLGSKSKILEKLVLKKIFIIQFVWILLLIVSFAVYIRLGVHLDHPVVLDLARLKDGNWGINPSIAVLTNAVIVIVALILVQWAFASSLNLRMQKFVQSFWTLRNRIRVAILSMIFGANLAFISIEGDLGAVQPTAMPGGSFLVQMFSDPILANLRPEFLEFESKQMQKKPNAVVVLADAFRYDVISPQQTPNIHRLLMRRECNLPSRHYAGAHMTSYGGFTLWHGMESYLYRPFTEARAKSRVLETLRTNGYALHAFDASGLTSYWPPVVAEDEFDKYQTYLSHPRAALKDKAAVEDFTKSWKSRNLKKPYVGFVFLYSTHDSYDSMDGDALFNDSEQDSWKKYLRSVRYVDELVGRMTKELDPDTVFIFSGDHGEEFGEYGSSGHVSVRFENVRTQVPLIFCLPDHSWDSRSLSSHADLWPTIFDWAGVPTEWRKKSFTGRSLLRQDEERRSVVLTGAYFPSSGRQLAIAVPEGKILLKANGVRPYDFEVSGYLDKNDQTSSVHLPLEKEVISELRDQMNRYFY